jgi:PAS domain S-box-containing protein
VELLARDLLRIVHIDDNDQFAGLTEHALRLAGFTYPIVHCDDGILALHYFSTIEPKLAPHVIILDLNMPNMNGLEVLHWLRNSHSEPDLAVYLLTSSEERADKEQAEADGVTKYLHKGPLFDELIKNLDHLISTTNAHRLEQARKMGDVMAELAFMSQYADDKIVLFDSLGRIEWVNEPFVRASGFTSEELRGKKPGMVLTRDADTAAYELLTNAVKTVLPCECQTMNHRKNGTPYPTHISLGPVFENNRLEGFLAVEKELSAEQFGAATIQF